MASSPLLRDGRFRPVVWASDEADQKKIATFKWRAETGQRGREMQINKQELRMDLAYQRCQSADKARRIAAEFLWAAFGVVIVSERENGCYYVIDGGHRVLACMMRPEIKNLPCLVFKGLTKQEEAAAYIYFNKGRKAPTGVQIFKAQVEAKDEKAIAVDRIMSALGVKISDEKDHCRCPVLLVRLFSALGPERFAQLAGLPLAAWPEASDNERFGDGILSGLVGFAKLLEPTGLHLAHPDVVNVLKKTTLLGLRKRALAASEILRKSRADGYKIAVVEAWNKGRRTNRIELGI